MNREIRRSALITRPRDDSGVLAESLERRGIIPVLAPMMLAEFFEEDIEGDLNASQAVLFTSRNGVRSFSRVSARRNIPVFAVGDSTSDLAKDIGFEVVESASGNSTDLVKLVTEKLSPGRGQLLHITGRTVAGDLSGSLSAGGFKVVRRTLYEAKPVSVLSEKASAAIKNQEIDYVLFFSPRTAVLFTKLVAEAGLTSNCRNLEAICLSEAVAAELSPNEWKVRRIAYEPTTDSLLCSIDDALGNGYPGSKTMSGIESDSLDLTPLRRAIERAKVGAGKSVQSVPPSQPAPKVETKRIPLGNPVDPEPSSGDDDIPKSESLMTVQSNEKQEKSSPGQETSGPASPPAEFRSRVPTVVWTLVVVFAIVFVGYFTLPMWRGELPKHMQEQLAGGSDVKAATDRGLATAFASLQSQNDLLNTKVVVLEQSLDELKARLTAIDELVLRQSGNERKLKELQSEVRSAARNLTSTVDPALLERIDALENSMSKTAVVARSSRAFDRQELDDRIAALVARINEQEEEAAAIKRALRASSSSDVLALAIGQLRDSLSRARPFEAEIATLKRLASDKADILTAIAPLEAISVKGVPSRSELLSRLPAVVDATVAAIRTTDQGDWIDRTISKLRGFVIVRRVDGKGGGTDAILARAEAAADRDDLSAAGLEISKLNINSDGEINAWLDNARARLTMEEAQTTLNRIVLNGIETLG